MTGIFQSHLPYDPIERPLPGVEPLSPDEWILFDDAFVGQMAERDRLLAEQRADVVALDPGAQGAAEELLDQVLALAYPDAGQPVLRADGARIGIDRSDPMGTLGRLVQEDFVLLQKQGDEHVLTGAVLCFPASWTLSEKFLRPLTTIHDPVEPYDDAMARRVQRLFDGVRPGRPMWRFNALWYDCPDLHQPRPEAVHRVRPDREKARFLRSERQCILRLPVTRAVVFSIHTFVIPAEALPGDQIGRTATT